MSKQLILEKKEVTPELVKARFTGEPDPDEAPKPTLLRYYEKHNHNFKELIGTRNHSSATHKRHNTSKIDHGFGERSLFQICRTVHWRFAHLISVVCLWFW